jgi:hypothetical protein
MHLVTLDVTEMFSEVEEREQAKSCAIGEYGVTTCSLNRDEAT